MYRTDINFHTFECEIETSQSVPSQRVCSTLKHYDGRTIHLHYFRHDRLEDHLIRLILYAVSERKVDSVVLAFLGTNILQKCTLGIY